MKLSVINQVLAIWGQLLQKFLFGFLDCCYRGQPECFQVRLLAAGLPELVTVGMGLLQVVG